MRIYNTLWEQWVDSFNCLEQNIQIVYLWMTKENWYWNLFEITPTIMFCQQGIPKEDTLLFPLSLIAEIAQMSFLQSTCMNQYLKLYFKFWTEI
jgi:hypothetical protein